MNNNYLPLRTLNTLRKYFNISLSVPSVAKRFIREIRPIRVISVQKGFTFAEVLIALAITSLLMVAVYSSFSLGTNVYKRSQKSALANYKPWLFMERFSRDAEGSFSFSNIPFQGGGTNVSFCGILDSGQIGRVTYYLADNSLYKKQQTYPQVYAGEDVEGKAILKNISSFSISYYSLDQETQDYVWSASWDRGKERPLSLKIELQFLDEESAPVNIAKTISLS